MTARDAQNTIDLIREAANSGIAAEAVCKRLGWAPDFFERCCKRYKITFAAQQSDSIPSLSEPVDVLLEHALIALGYEEQFVIAARIAAHLGFVLQPTPSSSSGSQA